MVAVFTTRSASHSHFTDAELADNIHDETWRLNNLYTILSDQQRPDGEIVRKQMPFRMKPQQADLHVEKHFLNIILKARQLGFTTYIQLYILDRCLWNADTYGGVIAQTLTDASSFFHKKLKFGYETLPVQIRDLIPLVKCNEREMAFGGRSNSTIQVGTSLRSGSFDILHVSEFAYICIEHPKKAREVITGSLNTVAPGNMVFIESTARGRVGAFFEKCQIAMKLAAMGLPLTELDYKFFFYPWWQDPKYQLHGAEHVTITPEYEEYFDRLHRENSHIKLSMPQKRWYVKKALEQGEDMKQEYPATPEEAFDQQLKGAIFASELQAAYDSGRVCDLPFMPGVPVNVFWDLGHNDVNSLWFQQRVGGFDHFIRYYENRMETIPHYIRVLEELSRSQGYIYGQMWLPHDATHKRVDSIEGSSEDILRAHGFRTRVVPRVPQKRRAIEDTRNRFPSAKFDRTGCEEGLSLLANYLRVFDETFQAYKDSPRHNNASNCADAFQVWGNGYRPGPMDEGSPQPGGRTQGSWSPAAATRHGLFNPPAPEC